MLLVKRELWRGPLCRHLSLQLPEMAAEWPCNWNQPSRGVEAGWRPREGNWEQEQKDKGGQWPQISCRNRLGVFRRQFCRNLLVLFQFGFSLILSSSWGWDSLQGKSTNSPDFRRWLRKTWKCRSIGECGRWTVWGWGRPSLLHLGFLKW